MLTKTFSYFPGLVKAHANQELHKLAGHGGGHFVGMDHGVPAV
jgi:hypothetical protein